MPILKQHEFKNPLHRSGRCVYFEDTCTGGLYSALIGACCPPDLGGRPGLAVLVAIDYEEDPRLNSVPTQDRWLRVLVEYEDFNFVKLVNRCIALRNKFCGREIVIPILNSWLSTQLDPADQRALADINRSLKRGKKFYLSAVQDQDMDFPNLVKTLYSARRSLDLTHAKRVKGYLAAFSREQAKSSKDVHKLWPGVAALALAVNMIVSARLWESPQIDMETRSMSDRRLDMLEKGSGTAFDEYERCLTEHSAEQSRYLQDADYSDYCPGETLTSPTIDENY